MWGAAGTVPTQTLPPSPGSALSWQRHGAQSPSNGTTSRLVPRGETGPEDARGAVRTGAWTECGRPGESERSFPGGTRRRAKARGRAERGVWQGESRAESAAVSQAPGGAGAPAPALPRRPLRRPPPSRQDDAPRSGAPEPEARDGRARQALGTGTACSLSPRRVRRQRHRRPHGLRGPRRRARVRPQGAGRPVTGAWPAPARTRPPSRLHPAWVHPTPPAPRGAEDPAAASGTRGSPPGPTLSSFCRAEVSPARDAPSGTSIKAS